MPLSHCARKAAAGRVTLQCLVTMLFRTTFFRAVWCCVSRVARGGSSGGAKRNRRACAPDSVEGGVGSVCLRLSPSSFPSEGGGGKPVGGRHAPLLEAEARGSQGYEARWGLRSLSVSDIGRMSADHGIHKHRRARSTQRQRVSLARRIHHTAPIGAIGGPVAAAVHLRRPVRAPRLGIDISADGSPCG